MFLKKTAAAVAALMLTASPVLAKSSIPAPQAETIGDASALAGTNEPLGILVGVTIVGLILYILVNAGDDEDDEVTPPPVSP